MKNPSDGEITQSQSINLAGGWTETDDLARDESFLQMSKSCGKILDALMQQKRQGNCPGFYGLIRSHFGVRV